MSELQKHKARINIIAARAARAKNVGPLTSRFWSKVDIRDLDECWPWKAAVRRKDEGYGAFWYKGRHRPASQIVWLLTRGEELRPPFQALHRCDNPPCCNPAHLFKGTNIQNNEDKVSKNRHAYGSRVGTALLTEADALEIKALKLHGRSPHGYRTKIAQRFGVSPATITDVWSSRRWKHLNT